MKRTYDDVLNHGEMVSNMVAIQIGLDAAYSFQLPRTTLKQHLKDCFGWHKPQPSFDAFVSAYLEAFMCSLEGDGIPRDLLSFAFLDPSKRNSGDFVEIDIVRGGRYV